MLRDTRDEIIKLGITCDGPQPADYDDDPSWYITADIGGDQHDSDDCKRYYQIRVGIEELSGTRIDGKSDTYLRLYCSLSLEDTRSAILEHTTGRIFSNKHEIIFLSLSELKLPLKLMAASMDTIEKYTPLATVKVEIPKVVTSITPAPATPHEIQPQVEANGEEIHIIWKPGGRAVWTHPDGGIGVVQINDQIDGNTYTISDTGNGYIEHKVSRHELSLYAVGDLKYGDAVLVSPPDDSDVWPKPFKGEIVKFVAHDGKRSAIIADDKNQWYTVPFEKFTKDLWVG